MNLTEQVIRMHRLFDTIPYANMRVGDVARILDQETMRPQLNGPVVTKLLERLIGTLSQSVLAVQGRPEWSRVLGMLSRSFDRIMSRIPEMGEVNESLALTHTIASLVPVCEPLELPPLPQLHEVMVRKGVTEFAGLVTDAYEARPVVEQAALPAYRELRKQSHALFREMQPSVRVEFVRYEPYKSAADLTEQVRATGSLLVNEMRSTNPSSGWSGHDWRVFHAVRDYVAHMGGRHEFSLRADLDTFNRLTERLSERALPAAFTEVVGRTCYAITRGRAPKPKACLLRGFDYASVGHYDAGEYLSNFEG